MRTDLVSGLRAHEGAGKIIVGDGLQKKLPHIESHRLKKSTRRITDGAELQLKIFDLRREARLRQTRD